MTKRIGYTEIIAPTSEQIADLERRLQSGELLRVVFENDGAGNITGGHYRRNHHFQPTEAHSSGSSDTVEVMREFCMVELEQRLTGSMQIQRELAELGSRMSQQICELVRRVNMIETHHARRTKGLARPSLFFAAAIIGALIAILTK